MQLHDAGGQLTSRPAPNATVTPGWANNDPTGLSAATISDPDFINAVQAESLVLTTATGQTMSKADVAQLYKAILALRYLAGGGSADALTASPTLPAGITLTALSTFPDGFEVSVDPAGTNVTTTPTFAYNGGSPITITDPLGNALFPGDIQTSIPARLRKKGGGTPTWQLLNQPARAFGANPVGMVSGGYLTVNSTTQLQFGRVNGGLQIPISGTFQTIPSSPITIANTGLTANTLYYAYVYMNSGTMTLELSATTHTLGPNGIQIKTGDAMRTFVGWIRTGAGTPGIFNVLSQQNILCVNFYNAVAQAGYVAINAGTASATPVELDSTKRINFISNGGVVFGFSTGEQSQNTNNQGGAVNLYLDGSIWTAVSGGGQNPTSGLNMPTTAFGNQNIAEGYHQLETYGSTGSGVGSATFSVDTTATIFA